MRAFAGFPVQPFTLGYLNAGSDCILEVTTLDQDDALLAPDAMEYRVDDLQSAQNVVPWTSVPTPASIQEIAITGSQNALVGTWNDTELRRVTVKTTDSVGRVALQVFLFTLVNISTPGLS